MVDLIIKQNPTIDWLFSYKDILKKHLHQELLQDLPAFILDEIQIEPLTDENTIQQNLWRKIKPNSKNLIISKIQDKKAS